MCSYRVEPHLVHVIPILVLWQLNAPLPPVLIRVILPSRNDSLLQDRFRVSVYYDKIKLHPGCHLEEVIVSLLGQLRRSHNIIIQSPEFLDAIESDDPLDILHPTLSSGRTRRVRNWSLRKSGYRSLGKVATLRSG